MGQVKEGEIIDAYEWKISDVDMHMYGDRQFSWDSILIVLINSGYRESYGLHI
jgi:hypothetical protein